eukprot:SAG31_NODE_512_length_14721_cov_17.995623_8_plen_337_part_00
MPHAGSPTCDRALKQACGAARHKGLAQCAFCAGANQSVLRHAGCNSSYVQSFCANQTCAAQLEDNCGSVGDDGCSSCVRCTADFPAVCAPAADAFCSDTCRASFDCAMQMQRLCGSARAQGEFQCATCAGRQHNVTGCSAKLLQSFCAGKGCVPQLADRCATATSASCFDCAICAQANHNDTGCLATEEDSFCQIFSKPATPSRPSCDALLVKYCNASVFLGPFECAMCAGKHGAELQNAHCNESSIEAFCAAPTCYVELLRYCGSVRGDCGGCAACSQNISHCDEATRRNFCNSAIEPEPKPESQLEVLLDFKVRGYFALGAGLNPFTSFDRSTC